MSIYDGPSIATTGLILAFDAANSISYPGTGTTWTDLSGNGRVGTLTGSPTYTTVNSGALQFSGTNYADIGINFYNLGIRRNATFSGWIYFTTSGNSFVISDWNSNLGMTLRINNAGSADFYIYGATTSPRITYTYAFSYNTWYNLVGVVNGTTMYMYLNGVDTGLTQPLTEDIGNSTETIKIGVRGDKVLASAEYVSNVIVYNRALSATEVLQNFNALRGRFSV